jgi:hypothetical protein
MKTHTYDAFDIQVSATDPNGNMTATQCDTLHGATD